MKAESSRESGQRMKAQAWRPKLGAGLLWLLLCAGVGPAAFAANTLRELEYTTPDSEGLRIIVTADEVFEKLPGNFSISNPPRIVVDLPDTVSGLAQRHYPIATGDVESIAALEAAGRTRLVVNLRNDVPYRLLTENDRLILAVGEVAPGGQLVSAAATATAAPSATDASSRTVPRAAATGSSLTDMDFRRTGAGGGQVELSFSGADVRVSEDKRVGRVVLSIPGVTVDERLRKTFDVTDFSTPVRSVKIEPVGLSGARVEIRASGRYEFAGTHTGNRYKAEFRPKVEPKVAQSRKEKSGRPGSREKTYSGQSLSLNFQDIEVRSVLQLLADFTGLNMVVSDTVGGNITLRLKDVPWDQALDIILQTKGLTSRRYGNVIMVAPIGETNGRYGDA